MKHIALWHIRWDKPALLLYSVCFCVSLVSVGFGPQVVKLALINQTNKQTQTGCVISDEARWLLYKKKDASVASTNFFASPAAFRSDPNSNEEVGAKSLFAELLPHLCCWRDWCMSKWAVRIESKRVLLPVHPLQDKYKYKCLLSTDSMQTEWNE